MPGLSRLSFTRAVTPLGSRLLGMPSESPNQQRLRVMRMLLPLLIIVNMAGAAVTVALVTVAIPGPSILDSKYFGVLVSVVPAYFAFAVAVGTMVGTLIAHKALRWATEGRSPTRHEQIASLALPWRLTVLLAALWFGAAATYSLGFGLVDNHIVPKIFLTNTLSGVAVAAFCYQLSEFSLRPIAAMILQSGDPRRIRIARVASRSILAWVLGSGVPISGLMIVAIFSFEVPVAPTQLAVSILVLGGITLVSGYWMTQLGSRATVDPIRGVTSAMAQIEQGDVDQRVTVYDGTELGQLQSGFNRMAEGLRDRERISELFGRHVGKDVAEAALRRKPELGGEERQVAVFFIDLVGSTKLASTRPPQEVVALLNRFFDVVVEEVDRNRGFINKFEGDGALAVFGAPADLEDAADQALATARSIRNRMPRELPECSAAIGVAFGTAVAGNIGARSRFEYTVIGDPVNEAARLCELAKNTPSKLLASEESIKAAHPREAAQWVLGDSVVLRGRSAPTRLASPRN